MFVCDCRQYGHSCQPEAAWDKGAYFETSRRLRRADIAVFAGVLRRRGWRVEVIFDCIAKDVEARRSWLLAVLGLAGE